MNRYVTLFQTIVVLAMAVYAVAEVRIVKREVLDRLETSQQTLTAHNREQIQKLDSIGEQVSMTRDDLANFFGPTVDFIRMNREKVVALLETLDRLASHSEAKTEPGSNQAPQATKQ